VLIKRIIKSPEQYQAYSRFMLRYEVSSFRIACVVGSVHTLIFLIIDYWRAEHYLHDVIWRSAMIFLLGGVTAISYHEKIRVAGLNALCLFTSAVMLIFSFILDLTAGMPVFFLPNFVCLLFYVFNAGLGHPLKQKSIHSGLALVAFVFYSTYFSPHGSSHLAQSFNIFLNATISLLIGFLIEQYKRTNFVQRLKIHELSNLKTKLLAIFSHDVSSPLNSLRSLLQLKDDNLISEAELNQHSQNVKKSIENVLDMLKNIVKWSALQLEGFKPLLEKTNINKITGETIESVGSMAELKGIKILNQVENSDQAMLDPEILKLVIRNFLTNAIKFSQPGAFVYVFSSIQNGLFKISVRDNGTGISPENLTALFTYKRLTSAGTLDEKGSGIGLSVTKEFVEMMKGAISVVSEVGKGSTFSATFPLQTNPFPNCFNLLT
jgi:signal transduction histidine kinase